MLEVGYSGNQGHHLTYNASINIDQLPVQDLSLGNQLNSQVRNPFYGTAGATGVYTGTTTALWRLLVPYPQFTGVSVTSPAGRQLQLQRAHLALLPADVPRPDCDGQLSILEGH